MTTCLPLQSPVTWRGVIQRSSVTVLEQLLAQERECRKENLQYIRPVLHVPWDSIPRDVQSNASRLLGLEKPQLPFIKLSALQYSLLCLYSDRDGGQKALCSRQTVFELILQATEIDQDHYLGANSSSLHLAAFFGLRDAYSALVLQGASPDLRNNLGYSSNEILSWAINTFPHLSSSSSSQTMTTNPAPIDTPQSNNPHAQTNTLQQDRKPHIDSPRLDLKLRTDIPTMVHTPPNSSHESLTSPSHRTRLRSTTIFSDTVDAPPSNPHPPLQQKPQTEAIGSHLPMTLPACLSQSASSLQSEDSTALSRATKSRIQAVCHTVEVVKDKEQRRYARPATPYVDSDASSGTSAAGKDWKQQNIHAHPHEPDLSPQAFHLTFIRAQEEGEGSNSSHSSAEANSTSSVSTIDSSDESQDYFSSTKLITPNTSLSSMSSANSHPQRKNSVHRHRHRISSSSILSPPIKPALKSPTRPQAHAYPVVMSDSDAQSPTSPKMVSWAEMLNVCVFESYDDGKDERWHVSEEELSPPAVHRYDSDEEDDNDFVAPWKGNDALYSLLDSYHSPELAIALRRNKSHCDVRHLFDEDNGSQQQQPVAPKVDEDIYDMEVQHVNANGLAAIETQESKMPSSTQGGALQFNSCLLAEGTFGPHNAGKPLPTPPTPSKITSRPLPTPPSARTTPTRTPCLSNGRSSPCKPGQRGSIQAPGENDRLPSSGGATPLLLEMPLHMSPETSSRPAPAAAYSTPLSIKAAEHEPVVTTTVAMRSTPAIFAPSALPPTLAPTVSTPSVLSPTVPTPNIVSDTPEPDHSASNMVSSKPRLTLTSPPPPPLLSPTSSSNSWLSKIFRPTALAGHGAKPNRRSGLSSESSSARSVPAAAPLDMTADSSENDSRRPKSIKSPTLSQILSPTARFSQLKSAISSGLTNTLRSPLFSPRTQHQQPLDPLSAAKSPKLSRDKDVEPVSQLPPPRCLDGDEGPRNLPSRSLPRVPSIAASARRQSTRSPQLYPDDAIVDTAAVTPVTTPAAANEGCSLSLTHAASIVVMDGSRPESRCQSRWSHQDHNYQGQGNQGNDDENDDEALKSPTSCAAAALLRSEMFSQNYTNNDYDKVNHAPLSPEKRRLLSQAISGRVMEEASPPRDREHLVRTVQAVSGRRRSKSISSAPPSEAVEAASIEAATITTDKKAPASRSLHENELLAGQGYDRRALERIVPNRPTVPLSPSSSWQYLHAVSHQVGRVPANEECSDHSSFIEKTMVEIEGIARGFRTQGYAVKQQMARVQLSDHVDKPIVGWRVGACMPQSTLSLTDTKPCNSTGILFIRVMGIKEFLLPMPKAYTMMSVRVDTGRERVDTDYVAIGDAEMLLGQEFCVPVFEDTTLTLTVHLMQAPHLFEEDDIESADNYRLLAQLLNRPTTTSPTTYTGSEPLDSPTWTTSTGSSGISTPSTFGTRGGGGRGRLGRLFHPSRLALPFKQSDSKKKKKKKHSGHDSTSAISSPSSFSTLSCDHQHHHGRASPTTSIGTAITTMTSSSSFSCTSSAHDLQLLRDPATVDLCRHALFDDELCIAKSAVRFKDLRHACEQEVTMADFEAFNNWYGPHVDRKNKTSNDFSMLEDEAKDDGDAEEQSQEGERSSTALGPLHDQAKMVARIGTKVCFIPGRGLDDAADDSFLAAAQQTTATAAGTATVGQEHQQDSREPYDLRECGQAERYFAWNRRSLCEGPLFYMTEGSNGSGGACRVWRRETFMLVGCKIWKRRTNSKKDAKKEEEEEKQGQQGKEGGLYLDLEDLDRVQTGQGSFSACPLYTVAKQEEGEAAKQRDKGKKRQGEEEQEAQARQQEDEGSFLPLRNGFRLWFKSGFTQDFYADDDKDAEEWIGMILEVCRGRPPKPAWL